MSYAFEYDSSKSESNKEKHGISFAEARPLWEDPFALVVPTRKIEGEKRFLLIGKLDSRVWSAIFTMRKEKIRIISVRRARKKEVFYYEKDQV